MNIVIKITSLGTAKHEIPYQQPVKAFKITNFRSFFIPELLKYKFGMCLQFIQWNSNKFHHRRKKVSCAADQHKNSQTSRTPSKRTKNSIYTKLATNFPNQYKNSPRKLVDGFIFKDLELLSSLVGELVSDNVAPYAAAVNWKLNTWVVGSVHTK